MLLSCVPTLTQMFRTMFKPENFTSLLKVTMSFIRYTIATSGIGKSVNETAFMVNKTLKHDFICDHLISLCLSHIRSHLSVAAAVVEWLYSNSEVSLMAGTFSLFVLL